MSSFSDEEGVSDAPPGTFLKTEHPENSRQSFRIRVSERGRSTDMMLKYSSRDMKSLKIFFVVPDACCKCRLRPPVQLHSAMQHMHIPFRSSSSCENDVPYQPITFLTLTFLTLKLYFQAFFFHFVSVLLIIAKHDI